jgi:16S rRNA (uracil1498-N3)-methyltransferase
MIENSKTPRYRFFLEEHCFDRANGKASCEDVKLNHQIRHVLRLSDGDVVQLLDGQGNIYNAQIQMDGRNKLKFAIEQALFLAPPAVVSTIYLPLIKPHRFEWALEKLTEVGISRITPFYSQRCSFKDRGAEKGAEGKSKRWQAICREAAEQCERSYLPLLDDSLSLDQLLSQDSSEVKLILRERSAAPDMVTLLKSLYNKNAFATISILAGPEGGFTEAEQEKIKAQNFTDTTIGGTILRSETACVLAAGLLSTIGF